MDEDDGEDLFVSWYMSRPYWEQKLYDIADYINKFYLGIDMNRLYVPAVIFIIAIAGVGIAIYSKNSWIQMSACFAAGGAVVACLFFFVYRYFIKH